VKKLRQDKRDLQTKLDTTQGFLVDANQLQQQIQLKQNDANGIEEQIHRHESAFKQTHEELDSVTVDYNKSVASKDAFQTLQKQIEVKNSQLEAFGEQVISVQNEIAAIHKLQPIQAELEPNLELYPKLQAQILEQEKLKQSFSTRKSLTEQLSAYQSLINQDSARLDLLTRDYPADASPQIRVGELKQALSDLEQKVENYQKEYNSFAAQSKSLSDQVGRLQRQLSQIEKLGPESKCDHCLRPLGGDYQSIKTHFTEEISRLEHEDQKAKVRMDSQLQEITGLKRQLEKMRTDGEQLQKTLHGYEQAQREKPQLEERLRQHRINVNNLNRALSDLGSDGYRADVHQQLREQFRQVEVGRDRYLQVTERLKTQPRLEDKVRELSEKKSLVEQETLRVSEQMKQTSFDPAQFQELEKRRDEVRLKLHQSQLNLKDFQHRKDTLCREIEQLRGRIDENRKHQSQIAELQDKRLYLEKLDSVLSDFKLYLIGRIRPALSRIARQLMSEMTDGKYSELELDENYDLFIYDGGQKFKLERFSGGEQDLANLCLRLAISILITESAGTDFSFIILDEVFGSQDQHRKENILKALEGLRTRFRQIFLITHIDDIKDQVESLINVFENEDGTSRLEATWQTV
ncbi:MAG: SMC family ATPase, partial [candidate division Zixibacteria bacterium]|nr:SMC family ATPase [candidate division Zixibacteria bacterium]